MVCCTSVCVGHSSELLGWRGMNAANLAGHPACPSSLFRPANAVQARTQLLPGRCCGGAGDLWVLRGHPGFKQAVRRGWGAPCVDFTWGRSQTSPLSHVNKYLRITAECSL